MRARVLSVLMSALMLLPLFAAVPIANADSLQSPSEGQAPPTGWSISGIVWQDYCKSDCTAGSSLRAGNGVPNEAEVRLAGVKVGLGTGWCRVSHAVNFATTNAQGQYSFGNLANGTYCVTVESRQSNTAFPKPGFWTRPSGRSPWHIASYTVIIHGKSRAGLNFGWDVP